VVFYKAQNLNFTTLQSVEVKTKLLNACRDICKHHIDKNERGIILTPSFVINEDIASFLMAEFPRTNFIVHRKGNKMENIIEQFKFTDGNCIMITPSGYEGMDLSGDLSRFQILVKAPFASLGEARMKHIATHYSQIYSIITLMKLVQGAGRSIRGPEDWAVTYMLDSNIHRLWTSKQMAWADEFSSSSKLFLD
jgi:Rad3-related DNA helicase